MLRRKEPRPSGRGSFFQMGYFFKGDYWPLWDSIIFSFSTWSWATRALLRG